MMRTYAIAVGGVVLFLGIILFSPPSYLFPIIGARWYIFLPAATLASVWLVWVFTWAPRQTQATQQRRSWWFVMAMILLVPVLAVGQQMWLRDTGGDPAAGTHDGAVETEAALSFLLHGENPYAADFRSTPFGRHLDFFSGGALPNPAWTHYVYPPGYLLASVPLKLWNSFLGTPYDQRMTHLVFLAIALVALWYGVAASRRPFAFALFALNPVFLWLFVTGYNDIAVIAALVVAVCAWLRGKVLITFLALGIAVTLKQSAVLFVPAFGVALLFTRRAQWIRAAAAFILPPLLVYVPFLIWDAPALIDDIIRFPSAGGMDAYPISGIGLSHILLQQGIIAGNRDIYPFWIWQAAAGVPVLVALLAAVRRHATAWMAVASSVVFTAAVWYTARYFNDSHLAFLLQMSLVALIVYAEQKRQVAM